MLHTIALRTALMLGLATFALATQAAVAQTHNSTQTQNGTRIQLGAPAPPAVAKQAEQTAPVRIGKQNVRPLIVQPDPTQGAAALSSLAPAEKATLVLRASDNLVGISHHELTVRGADPNQIAELTRSLLPTARTRSFPQLDITIIRVPRFADLAPLAEQLNESLPQARVNLPIQWAPYQTR